MHLIKTRLFAWQQIKFHRGMGEYVDFFGRKSYTTTLIPRLALKTDKTAIFCSINKANNAGFLGVNLHPSSEDLYDKKSKHLLSLNQSIEKLIYENIYDYSWEYKKYRRPYQGDMIHTNSRFIFAKKQL